ncbi:hypothetical protein MBANPS3_001050 [Mucor bainieri]
MSTLSINVKYQNKVPLRLSLDYGNLVVETLGDKGYKKTVGFKFIYGIDRHEDALDIYTAMPRDGASPYLEVKANANPTLLNVRPDDTKWALRTLHYQTDPEASTAVSEFVTQLQESVFPDRHTYSLAEVIAVLNPASGAGLAECRWVSIVKPMLIRAGFVESNLSSIATKRDGSTRALAKDLGERILATANENNRPPPIIAAIGGDGTVQDVINGLADAAAAVTAAAAASRGKDSFAWLNAQNTFTWLRLAVIPTGSVNAFAASRDLYSVEQATLKLINETQESSIHYMEVKLGHSEHDKDWEDHVKYDKLKKLPRLVGAMSWGFHPQVVSKSRYLRWFMGNTRFSLAAMYVMRSLKQYRGELILPDARPFNSETSIYERPRTISFGKSERFTYFLASKQHSLEKGFKMTPDDMDLVILRDADKDSLTEASIQAFQGGSHVMNSGVVDYYKITELILRVSEKAEICLDGTIHELPPNGVVHLEVKSASTDKIKLTIFA